jgi:hypothetical protein
MDLKRMLNSEKLQHSSLAVNACLPVTGRNFCWLREDPKRPKVENRPMISEATQRVH